jgi:hypothetical protein
MIMQSLFQVYHSIPYFGQSHIEPMCFQDIPRPSTSLELDPGAQCLCHGTMPRRQSAIVVPTAMEPEKKRLTPIAVVPTKP